MKTLNEHSSKLLKLILIFSLSSGLLSMAQAQDNPKPSSWRNIDIKITETYGNNQTRSLRGAKVTIDLENRSKSDGRTRFPQTKTSGSRGATFTRMPPSHLVGKYIVTVDPKPSDKNNEFSCKAKTKYFNHSGSTQQFTFKCLKVDMQNESARRSKGGYDLTIQLKQNSGTRGRGLWVVVYDNNNKRLKWVRSSGTSKAVIRAVDPAKGPYRIAVHNRKNDNKPLYTEEYNMSDSNSTLVINLDSGNGAGNSQSSRNNSKKMECHKVQVKSLGGARRNGTVTLESCPDQNGYWSIKPYKY